MTIMEKLECQHSITLTVLIGFSNQGVHIMLESVAPFIYTHDTSQLKQVKKLMSSKIAPLQLFLLLKWSTTLHLHDQFL